VIAVALALVDACADPAVGRSARALALRLPDDPR
jgi:hypothetical protein